MNNALCTFAGISTFENRTSHYQQSCHRKSVPNVRCTTYTNESKVNHRNSQLETGKPKLHNKAMMTSMSSIRLCIRFTPASSIIDLVVEVIPRCCGVDIPLH
jgi:hypothetical protein